MNKDLRYPYRWHWRRWPTDAWGESGLFKGQACRVLVRGSRNSALIQYSTAELVVTSHNGLRRRKKGEVDATAD